MRRALALAGLALAACFTGESTRGLPCGVDLDCGADLACVDGVCGGSEPAPSYYSGLSLLFVVTDDPDSAAVQARVAAAAAPVVKEFVDADLDLRVGFVSTAMAHPLCGAGHDGALLLASCRDRADDFGAAFTAACDLRCPSDLAGDAAAPRPTAVAGSETRPRPWLERGPLYGENLTFEDYTLDRFVGCFVARGVDGCAYEQPLAALLRALRRMRDPRDDNYGFVEPGALLIVMFVGRGPECSYAADAAGIFDPDGERALWDDPARDPTPAICWNAGAACTNLGDDGEWFECHPVDRGVDGRAVAAADAALLSVDVAADELRQAVDDLDADLLLTGVLGVPPGFAGALDYSEPMPLMPGGPADPFGVAPGCAGAGDDPFTAAPPLRLLAVAEALGQPDVPFFPACIDDLASALTPFARMIVTRMRTPRPAS